MELLTILQLVVIAVSLISLVCGYMVTAREKNKDQRTEIFTRKLLDNVWLLRENIARVLAYANPQTIREQLKYNTLPNSFKNFEVYEKIGLAINKIKSTFFPFYPQENHLIASLESLRKTVIEYGENPNNKLKEEVLKGKIRNVYMEFALYDKAMAEAISKQATESNFTFYTFDEFYEQTATAQKLKGIREKFKLFNRKNQQQFVDEEQVQNFMAMNKK